jgi:hypothetical protein
MILVVPVATPNTEPELTSTLAMDVLALLHVPPEEASLKIVVVPTQKVVTPVTDAGSGFTVIKVVATHPALSE